MDALSELHEASLLQNVALLFGKPSPSAPGRGSTPIYSSVGPVLIALNPVEQLPIYGPAWTNAYPVASGNIVRNKELGPHAYRRIRRWSFAESLALGRRPRNGRR